MYLQKHVLFLQKQTELYPTQPKCELKGLSDTRWDCRYAAADTMCHIILSALIATLEEIVHCDDNEKAVQGSGLLFQVKSFSFLLLLIIFDRILSCTNRLSDLLHRQQCNLAKATDLVPATFETLEKFRSNRSWKHLLDYAQQVAELSDLSVTTLEPKPQDRQSDLIILL